MERSRFEQQLRQLKRRRIEIRSAKAALDLEDLDLDDQQSRLEGLLASKGAASPALSTESEVGPSNTTSQSAQLNVKATHHLGYADSSFGILSRKRSNASSTRRSIEIGDANTVGRKRLSANSTVVDDFHPAERIHETCSSQADANDDDVVMTGHRQTPLLKIQHTTGVTRTGKRKRSPIWKAGFGQSLSPDPVTVNSIGKNATPERRTKVVILKVRVDPRILQEKRSRDDGGQESVGSHQSRLRRTHMSGLADETHPSRHLQVQTPVFQRSLDFMSPVVPPTLYKEKAVSSNFDLNFASLDRVKQHFQSSPRHARSDSNLVNNEKHPASHSSSESTASSASSTRAFVARSNARSNSSSQYSASVSPLSPSPSRIETNQTCPCQDRDPDCRICRGTPAAIVESCSFLTSPLPSRNASCVSPALVPSAKISLNSLSLPSDSQFNLGPSKEALSSTGKVSPEKHDAGPRTITCQSPGQHLLPRTSGRSRDRTKLRVHRNLDLYPRSRAGPSTYLIPDFEEMSQAEQQDLELRFCRRILVKIAACHTDDIEASLSGTGNHTPTRIVGPTFIARIPTHIKRTMIQRTSKILRMSQSTTQNLTMGLNPANPSDTIHIDTAPNSQTTVLHPDKEEFAATLSQLVHDLTRHHPINCCTPSDNSPAKTPLQSRRDTRSISNHLDRFSTPRTSKHDMFALHIKSEDFDDNAAAAIAPDASMKTCWAKDMQCWIRTLMQRCDDCIEACVFAVNLDERRKLVDEWEL